MSTTPIWSGDAGLPTWAPWQETRREEIVIVGAGLAGLGLARALRELGADPLVVDARGPAAGASGRNAGFVLRTHVTEYPKLRARVGPSVARALLGAAAENAARIARIVGTACDDAYRATGSLMLASGPDEIRVLAEAERALREDGVRVAAAPVPPALAGFDAALRIADDAEVHPGRLAAALASGVRGAVFHAMRVDEHGVSDGARRIDAEHVVVATNAWTGELVPELASVITPQRAQMIATAPIAHALDTPCYAGLGFDYFRQRADGRVLLGGRRHLFLDAESTRDESTTPSVQAALDAYLVEHLGFARGAEIAARWSGIMAFSPDGLPLAGRLADVAGRPWILAGWTGHGLGLSLAVGARLARAILTTDPAEDALLSAFDPGRFSAMFARP